ncbi:MAG: preprotein translocase subunit SecE [Clostridia bacterium]|nr:preprotein translocase subunit SecE [Clostridia bacterium]
MTEEKQTDIYEGVVETEKPAKDKKVKDEKKTQKQAEKDKSKDKKKGKKKDNKERKSFGRRVKEIMSELKKVTWPTFPEVVKKTGIVIAFVLIFGLFLFGVNYLLGGLSNLLNGGTWF